MCPYPRSGAGKAAHGGAAGILLAGLLLVCLFHEPLGPGVNAQSMEGTCLQDRSILENTPRGLEKNVYSAVLGCGVL